MMRNLYQALRSAGASDEDAAKAAEEVVTAFQWLTGFKLRLSKIEGDLNVLNWMVGTVIALVIAILGLLLRALPAIH